MPAHRKLDAHAVEQIVAARAAGTSYRHIAASLECSHSTVSRRVASDPELHFRIAAATKREARRARDRERKARAKARREAALQPASPPEQGQRPPVGPSPGEERALLEPAPQPAPDPARLPPGLASTPYPGLMRRGRRQRERILASLPRGSVERTPRSCLDEWKAVPVSELRPDLVSMHGEGERQDVDPDEVEASLPRGEQEAPRVSRTRPHGRRDELRAARRIILDLTASFEARQAARETLRELLRATRSNGRPAYSLQQAAAKALLNDPVRLQEYRRQSASPSKGGVPEPARARPAEPDIEHELGRERHELEAAPGHQPADRDEPAEGRDRLPFSPQPRTVRVGSRDLLLFPDTPEGEEARFAYYEGRRLVDPPNSILDSNDVRSGRLTPLERAHVRRMGR
jgi:hypothetical protein